MEVIKYSVDFTDIDDVETLLKCADESVANAIGYELSAGILTALSDLKLSLELLLKEMKK